MTADCFDEKFQIIEINRQKYNPSKNEREIFVEKINLTDKRQIAQLYFSRM